MLKFLGKLLNRDLTTPAEPIDTNVSEDEIWEILHPKNKRELALRKKNLQSFLQFAASQLNKTECQRLCRVAKRALDDSEDMFGALEEVMFGEEGQRRGKWVFIQLDCKAREEIVWQASEILATFGISERWEHDCEAEFRSVPEALLALSDWLAERDLTLLHFETNSDSYCSVIVRASESSTAKELALAAHLTLYDHAEFSRANI
ncbi:hypothetical protein DFR40_1905 [Azonexus fungiphilus]|uniref:DUF6630 domain-containing protein n=1 Tax=Azonexus fungiphilus TaxID=146940 RepID=A0A495WAZ9_9RHOO|nr:hypothetical protein [Azonexus fungiphilus]RKT58876.1 hypothetical protein DFR40_1905 [Azonexus fungiphilus]